MLSALLQTLQGFLPKRFFIVSLGPVLISVLLNSTLLYFEDVRFRAFAGHYLLRTTESGLDFANMFIVLLIALLAAFVYSMLISRLRGLLEGREWPARINDDAMVQRQNRSREQLTADYESCRDQYDQISRTRAEWKERLREARGKEGKQGCTYPPDHEASQALRQLETKMGRGQLILFKELASAAEMLRQALETNVVDAEIPGAESDRERLNNDHVLAGRLPQYALARLSQESVARKTQIAVSFPPDNLAPTAIGNVARSVSAYARQRYGIDLDFMWTRLQKVMQSDAHFQTLMEAQMRVDFLVATFWLLVVSLVFWFFYQLLAGTSPSVFLLLAIGGPVVLLALYRLCLENYRAFADVLRSAVDLFRFDLLRELHLPLPADGEQEMRLWLMINRQMAYGETQSLPFDHQGRAG
jgi:hypothetical protein